MIFDLETDGLIETCTTIHCASFYDLHNNSLLSFYPGGQKDITKLRDFIRDRLSDNLWIGHNILKFDREVLKKLLDIELPEQLCQDTLIWSQMLWPDIPIPQGCRGRHSLEAWGVRFGVPKPIHEDWSKFSKEMLHRNKEDVNINVRLWQKVIKRVGISF